MTLHRFSSRTKRLDREFLAKSLEGTTRYLRIAGYFRSSIFELVGEEISKIPEVKIICNSELDMADFQVTTGRTIALKERWNEVDVEAEALLKKERYQILDKLLKSGNVEVGKSWSAYSSDSVQELSLSIPFGRCHRCCL